MFDRRRYGDHLRPTRPTIWQSVSRVIGPSQHSRALGRRVRKRRVTAQSQSPGRPEVKVAASLMELCYPDPIYRAGVGAFMASRRDGWMDIRMRTKEGREIDTSWANVRFSGGSQIMPFRRPRVSSRSTGNCAETNIKSCCGNGASVTDIPSKCQAHVAWTERPNRRHVISRRGVSASARFAIDGRTSLI